MYHIYQIDVYGKTFKFAADALLEPEEIAKILNIETQDITNISKEKAVNTWTELREKLLAIMLDRKHVFEQSLLSIDRKLKIINKGVEKEKE